MQVAGTVKNEKNKKKHFVVEHKGKYYVTKCECNGSEWVLTQKKESRNTVCIDEGDISAAFNDNECPRCGYFRWVTTKKKGEEDMVKNSKKEG